MKVLQWIAGIYLFMTGLAYISTAWYYGLVVSFCGALLIPAISSNLNFRFYNNDLKRRLFKIFVLIIGNLMIVMGTIHLENEQLKSNLSLYETVNSYKGNYQDAEYISLISNLSESYKHQESSLTNEQIKLKNEIDFVLSLDSIHYLLSVKHFNCLQIDSLENGLIIDYIHNPKLNGLFNSLILKRIKTVDSFESQNDYLLYRMSLAEAYGDKDCFVELLSTMIESGEFNEIPKVNLLKYLESNLSVQKLNKFEKLVVQSQYADDVEIITALIRLNSNQGNIETELKCRLRLYKLQNTDIENIKHIGEIYEQKNWKKSMMKYYSLYLDRNGSDKSVCKKMRELTKFISSWYEFRVCCDGSRSNAWGRGVLSSWRCVQKRKRTYIWL